MKIRFNVPPVASNESNGLGVRYAPAKREVPRWRWRLLVALVLAAPLYLLLQFGLGYWWYTAPGFVVMEQLTIRPGSTGFIGRIAEEGERIARGETLLTLSVDRAPGATNSVARHDASRAALALAEKQLAQQQRRLTTMQQLMQEGAATRADVDAELAKAYEVEAHVIRSRADLAAMHEADAGVSTTNNRFIIQTAPFDGVIAQRYALPGQWVAADTDVLVLQAERAPSVVAYIEAEHADYAQAGQAATLKFHDGERVRARVVDVSLQAARLPPERVSPLSPRSQSIVIRLQPEKPIEPRHGIHMLPLDVRFSRW